jgi:hypothetical protein
MKSLKTVGLQSPLLFIIQYVSDFTKLKQSKVITFGNDTRILNMAMNPGVINSFIY